MKRSWISGTIRDRLATRWMARRLANTTESLDLFSCLKEARNILVVPNDRVGGLFFGVSACKLLRQHYPDARLSLLVRAQWSSLARQIPYADAVIEADLGKPVGSAAFRAIQHQLAATKLDLAFCLGSDCSFRLAQLARYSGARVQIGFPRQGPTQHTIEISLSNSARYETEQNIRMLHMLGIQGDSSVRWSLNAAKVKQMRERYLTGDASGRTVALDLSGGEGDGLSRQQVEDIIGRIIERGGRALVFYTQSERRQITSLMDLFGARMTPFEQKDPATIALLLPGCNTLIACNTDLLHMGIALETPVIGLFDEDAQRWVQYGNERVKLIQATDIRGIATSQVDRALDEAFSGRSSSSGKP